MGSWPNLGVLLCMAISLLLRGVGFYPLSSIVEVVCPFFMKESFVLGLSGLSFFIFFVCDLGVCTNKFYGWIVEKSFVECISRQNGRLNKYLELILYFH